MKTLNKYLLTSLLMLSCSAVVAANKVTEFSADAVISMPQTPVKQSKLFVGKQAVRRESQVNGQNMIEIVYPDQGKAVMINDFSRSYEERTFNAVDKQTSSNPCDQIINAKCQNLGREDIDGIQTEKWQIVSNDNGRPIRTLHWIDIKRKLALREFFPDGSMAELKLVKKEKVNGRNTEKWQRILLRSDGSTNASFQWYDTELGIAIREELPGGYLRELKNIKISNQSNDLFTVPSDYVRVTNAPQRNNQSVNFNQR